MSCRFAPTWTSWSLLWWKAALMSWRSAALSPQVCAGTALLGVCAHHKLCTSCFLCKACSAMFLQGQSIYQLNTLRPHQAEVPSDVWSVLSRASVPYRSKQTIKWQSCCCQICLGSVLACSSHAPEAMHWIIACDCSLKVENG